VIASGNWPSRSASWAFVSVPKRASQSGVRVPDDHDGTGLELVGSDADDLLDAGFIMPTSLRDAIPKPPMQPRILVLSASAGLYSENNY
jgi:hypothetical protein